LIRFDAVNAYQKDKGEYADSPDIGTPTDSIQLTFTVSGFNSDNPDAVEGAGDATSTNDDGTAAATSEVSSDSSSSSPVVPVVIVIIVIVVVVVVVVKKYKK
jgi:cobalamin biosynthesis Mg chelatase CobN